MAAASKYTLAKTGTTGNNTHTGVDVGRDAGPVALQFIVEAVGATPTVTYKYQGTFDGTNWFDIAYITDASDTLSAATKTVTGTGASMAFIDRAAGNSRNYATIRLVTSANTNVTYRAEMYTIAEAVN